MSLVVSIVQGNILNLYVPLILFMCCFDTVSSRDGRERSGERHLKIIYFFKENLNYTYIKIIAVFVRLTLVVTSYNNLRPVVDRSNNTLAGSWTLAIL